MLVVPSTGDVQMPMTPPYLLFLGDARDDLAIKSAHGLVDWRPEQCVGQMRLPGCKGNTGLSDLTIDEALSEGARTFVIGVANAGGTLSESWTASIVAAIEAGLDVVSGMHAKLTDNEAIRIAAEKCDRELIDVRHVGMTFDTGKGTKRSGRRLLTVGTDCSVGKMYATLALEREMKSRGMDADFKATGQSGIIIAGSGVPVDAVVADFISGAVEFLSPDNADDHWDLIEGQGSLFHPSFAGVSLGILHGAQPDVLVLCHEPTRNHMRGLPDQPLPGIMQCIKENERAARLTNPVSVCIGICVNTSALSEETAAEYMAGLNRKTGLPVTDPMRNGVAAIVDAIG